MQLPRLTKSIFLDQFIFMQFVGAFIGLIFPTFLVWYGFDESKVLTLDFYLVSLIAGQVVGLISFFLISTVIRPHLKLLSNRMESISNGLQAKTLDFNSEQCKGELCRINVESNDEIGVSAKAYNQLLNSLIKSYEVEKVFNEFTVVMSENLELEKLSEKAISLLLRSTNFEAAAVLIIKNGELSLVSSHGILNAESLISHEIVLKVVKDLSSVKITLPKNIDLDGVLTKFKPSEVFISPIESKRVILGVLIAATGSVLADARTEQLDKLFSRSIGLAVNNAIIHSKFQHLAAIDSLTSIYNRRFGMKKLDEDFARSVRDKTNLSLAMVDIDHFKLVNDNYGHLVGDKVIKTVTKIISGLLRKGDIVVRYGGEEFLIILHGASSENAHIVCERIRHQVIDTAFKEGDKEINLTVSIGISCFPEQQVVTEIELVDQADKALYFSKRNGRNKVSVFGSIN